MRARAKRRKLLLTFFCLAILICLPLWLMYRQVRLARLDHDLIAAIKAGDDLQALADLRAGADPNSQDTGDPAPTSLRDSLLAELQHLLGHKPKPLELGPTALMLAVEKDETTIVQTLLDRGATGVNTHIESVDEEGAMHSRPLLLSAVESGNVEIIRALLDHGADVHAKDEQGDTALICAISAARLEKNADAQQKAEWKETVQSYTAIVQLLLEHGADPDDTTDGQWTALALAVSAREVDIVKALLSKGARVNPNNETTPPLFCTSDPMLLRLLLDHGANVNAWGDSGRDQYTTALLMAASDNNIKVIRLLVKHGADMEQKDDLGRTVLMLAVQNGDVDTVRYLLRHGAKPNAGNKKGETALMHAASDGSEEKVTALLAGGADPNARDHGGITALMCAANAGKDAIVPNLLNHGARVNASDIGGQTVLMYGARGGSDSVLSELLKRGALVNAHDNDGATALMIAAENNHDKAVAELLAHGARLNVRDKHSETALDYAESVLEEEGIDVVIAHLKKAGARK